MDDFDYTAASAEVRGGFGWNLRFKWDYLTKEEIKSRRSDPAAHIKTPIISGGLFSIGKFAIFYLDYSADLVDPTTR